MKILSADSLCWFNVIITANHASCSIIQQDSFLSLSSTSFPTLESNKWMWFSPPRMFPWIKRTVRIPRDGFSSFLGRRFAFLLPFILHLSFIDFEFTVKSPSNKFSLRIIKLLIQIDFPVFPFFSHTHTHTQSRFNDKVARSWCLIFRKQLRTLFEIALLFFSVDPGCFL